MRAALRRVSRSTAPNPCRFPSAQPIDASTGVTRLRWEAITCWHCWLSSPGSYSRTGVGAGGDRRLCLRRRRDQPLLPPAASHRSFSCPLWLEHSFAIIAVCCLEDTPARWVATHRLHHHRADERPDPHSPLVSLFWSYIGWLFIENTDLHRATSYDRYARDIIRDKFYRWIERKLVWITLAQSLAYFAAGFLIGIIHRRCPPRGAAIWRERLALGRRRPDRSGLACHLVRKFLSASVRLPQLRNRRQQPQQCVGGDHHQR